VVGVGLAYFAVVIGIAIWAGRRTRTAEDFFLAGKGIGLIALTLAAMASTFSGFTFIGGPGLLYAVGLGAMFFVLPASVTNVFTVWTVAKRLRFLAEVRPVFSIPGAIGLRFGSRAAQGWAGAAVLFGIVGYMGTNVLALGIVLDALFGVGLAPGIWIGTAVVLAYSSTGGIMAGIYTDVFQGTLMAGASVLVFFYALGAGGGLGEISATLLATEPEFVSPFGLLTPIAALSFYLLFSVGVVGQPHVMHKFFMIRDPSRLKWYPLLVTFAMVLVILLMFGVGMSYKALVVTGQAPAPANPDDTAPLFLLNHTPRLLSALVFSGIAAAMMSTVDAFLNVGAAAITHDLPTAFGRPVTNELRAGRIATVVLAVAAGVVAQASGTLVALLGIAGYGLLASALVPSLAIGLNWPGATRAAAIASMATGLVASLVLGVLTWNDLVLTVPEGITIGAMTLALSIGVFLAVAMVTEGGTMDELDEDVRLALEL
jgi:Na+/proline symporter